ncbi:hypothetical protein QQ045_007834 [Rhodiola kirilowii]
MLQEGKCVEMRYMDTYSKMFNLDGESRINAAGFIHKYFRGKTLAHFGSQALLKKLLPLLEVAVHKALNSWSGKESIEVKLETSSMVFVFTARSRRGWLFKNKPWAEASETNFHQYQVMNLVYFSRPVFASLFQSISKKTQ